MNERQDARWKFTNARVVRVKHLEKVTFATLLVQAGKYPDYHDVVAFDDERHGLDEGKPVTLSGEMTKRKDPKDGQYKLQLIVRKYESGVEALAPKPRNQEAPKSSGAPPQDDSDDVNF